MPFGAHWYDLLPLLLIALLLFGSKRLPEMGSAVGKTIKEFQKSMREVTGGDEKPAPAVMPPVAMPTAAIPPAATPAIPAASAEIINESTASEKVD